MNKQELISKLDQPEWEHLGLSHREHFRASILKPMIDKNLLTLTIPDRPTSPKQKYQNTKRGK